MSQKFSYSYPLPAVTVDLVIFTISRRGVLEVLLIERRDDPFKGFWALPGGFVDVGAGYNGKENQGESILQAAARELSEETDLDVERDNIYLEQLYTFGEPGRDPRGRVVSVAHFALVGRDTAPRVRAGDDAAKVMWTPFWNNTTLWNERPLHMSFATVDQIPTLAFDHGEILKTALQRLRGKIDYEPRLAKALLPPEFTMTEFRVVHEIVKGTAYDASNFAKRFQRMVEDGRILQCEGTANLQGVGRPPRLYRFHEGT